MSKPMKIGGRLHKIWWKLHGNIYLFDHMWIWRPICWITREHKHNDCLDRNMGRIYCVYCNWTKSKDPWRIKRDKERNGTH